jgi:hypothetical protein
VWRWGPGCLDGAARGIAIRGGLELVEAFVRVYVLFFGTSDFGILKWALPQVWCTAHGERYLLGKIS